MLGMWYHKNESEGIVHLGQNILDFLNFIVMVWGFHHLTQEGDDYVMFEMEGSVGTFPER